MSKNLTEKTINSQKVYAGRVVNLRLDTVELPDGRQTKREVIEHRGAVAVVPILQSDTIVMVRQYRQPVGETLLEIPAGTLDDGENPYNCAHRELIEETGYSAGKLEKMFSSYLAPGYSSEMLHTYIAENLAAVGARAEADEFLDVVLIKLDDALGKIQQGEIKDAKTICGLLMAMRTLNRG